jgi:hypothetical protein
LNAVFEFDSIEDLMERARKLFALLPDPKFNVPVAETSPLNRPTG